eukprot:SAG22_NODE_655_length_8104_cov_6.498438_12_plen_67_part_00
MAELAHELEQKAKELGRVKAELEGEQAQVRLGEQVRGREEVHIPAHASAALPFMDFFFFFFFLFFS